MEKKKKQVILDYVEHQEILDELQKFKDYAKLLESGENVMIIKYSANHRGYLNTIPEFIQGSDKIKEFFGRKREELSKVLLSYNQERHQYEDTYYKYKGLLHKLEDNWIYKLFYSKKK